MQVQFSLLAPNLNKQKMVKRICEENGIKFFAYSPLGFGILCQEPNINNSERNSFLRNLIFKAYDKSTLKLRKSIKQIAQTRSVSMAQVVINWCCYQGAIPLVGIRKRSHVVDIANVFSWDLTSQEFLKLDEDSRNCLKTLPNNPFTSK